MRWVSYLAAGGIPRVGLVDGDRVRAVADVRQLTELLGDEGERLAAAAGDAADDPVEVVALAELALQAPIPVPPSIRDFMAFEEHVATARMRHGGAIHPRWYERPAFYFTNPAAVRGPREDIPISPGCSQFDYELEVAAVIGRAGSDLHPDQAEAHIAGYTVLADWSARDLQREEMAVLLGPVKGKDTATSLGPCLVTSDEIESRRSGRGFDLKMTAHVNGKLYSEGNWSDIYWSFAEMIAYASRGTKLVPGDVIGSGTVGTGCLLELSTLYGEDRFPWLRPGDEVRLTVERLGELVGRIVPGSAPIPLRGHFGSGDVR